jgi:hypothetical protein
MRTGTQLDPQSPGAQDAIDDTLISGMSATVSQQQFAKMCNMVRPPLRASFPFFVVRPCRAASAAGAACARRAAGAVRRVVPDLPAPL